MPKSFRVVLTREEEDARKDAELIRRAGFEVRLLPLIKTRPLDFEPPRGRFNYVVFQSKKALKYYLLKAPYPEGATPVAVGRKTAEAVKELLKLEPLVAQKERAEGLVELFKSLKPGKVLLPRSAVGREELIKELPKLGFEVKAVNVYATEPVLYESFSLEPYSVVLLFSPSAAKALFANLQKSRTSPKELKLTLVAVGPTTEKALKQLGLRPVLVAPTPSVEGVLELLKSLARKLQ
ncbi:MAG: uroporphyrinogen-III synthase [Aquificae bacterium]|nr:uroporphyrinogen-III synthase [Aquificota bacterium]